MIDLTLETAIRSAWCAATASGDAPWTHANPPAGHCDVTALIIRERKGGDVQLAQVFREGDLSEHHYWNVLPDGTELDLTSEQFDGTEAFGEATTMDAAFFAAAGPMRREVLRRLDDFRRAVDGHLAADAAS